MTATTIQIKPTTEIPATTPDALAPRLRKYLEEIAGRAIPVTYLELANALQVLPPGTIHRLTESLERLMAEDAAAGHPFIASLVISRAHGSLPAAGFFDCAARLGRPQVDATGPDALAFHAKELSAAVAFWGVRGQSNVGRLGENSSSTDVNPAKFRNDVGVTEICVGLKKFKCIGVSPPHDHPHIYLDMGDADTILCPYCAVLFRYDSRLSPDEAYPPSCVYSDDVGS